MEPAELARSLTRLASNHHWTWESSERRLLDRIPTSRHGLHPVEAVSRLSGNDLESLLADAGWLADLSAAVDSLSHLLEERVDPEVVYFSPEFAISELIPQYSGGLGVLAGDHLKAASDLGMALAGVGLFYHQGFFRQSIDGDRQIERHELHDPAEFGCVDTGIVVSVPMPHGEVFARVWQLDIGRSPLVLLDTDVPQNSPQDIAICDRLYGADRADRLRQEMVLGVGGMRAVAELGWTPRVVHLNEGHAGFVVLPLLDEIIEATGANLETARARVRDRIVFTTHTPVAAGIELFEHELISPYLALWARRWVMPVESLLELGADPGETTVFNMTALCLGHSRSANGVSRLHGEVSRELFRAIPGGDRIGSVTNGVHARSWVHPVLQRLFDERLGPSWSEGDPAAWSRAGGIENAAITRVRRAGSERLAELIEQRTDVSLNPEAMVVGFARRFAPYKRATLLLRHRDRLLELLNDERRPVQLIFSGKAHPADRIGKGLLTELVRFSQRPDSAGRLIFIPGYDMEVARAMSAGCDIWLNTPIRPREASGTSGEKAALNGGLNCSILDGWWAEMFDGRNGWEIPASDAEDPEQRDDEESAAALNVLGDIAAEFFDFHDSDFIERIRYGWMDLGPQITAARMVGEYRDSIYGPAMSQA